MTTTMTTYKILSEPFAPLRETPRKIKVASKRYFALCIMHCALIWAFAAGPHIEFPETLKSFGTFNKDFIQTIDFDFVNTGDEPLLILNVNTDCGCTAAGYPKEEIMPGDTAKISVRYNGRNTPTGTFRKQVRVRSNDPDNPMVRLIIRGKAVKG